MYKHDEKSVSMVSESIAEYGSTDNLEDIISSMKEEMKQAAKALEFEKAAELRDRIKELNDIIIFEF